MNQLKVCENAFRTFFVMTIVFRNQSLSVFLNVRFLVLELSAEFPWQPANGKKTNRDIKLSEKRGKNTMQSDWVILGMVPDQLFSPFRSSPISGEEDLYSERQIDVDLIKTKWHDISAGGRFRPSLIKLFTDVELFCKCRPKSTECKQWRSPL